MNKSINHIDQLFQAHFERHEIPLDNPDQIWNDIQQNQPKRRFVLLFLTSTIVIMGILFSYYYFNFKRATSVDKESESTQNFTINNPKIKESTLIIDTDKEDIADYGKELSVSADFTNSINSNFEESNDAINAEQNNKSSTTITNNFENKGVVFVKPDNISKPAQEGAESNKQLDPKQTVRVSDKAIKLKNPTHTLSAGIQKLEGRSILPFINIITSLEPKGNGGLMRKCEIRPSNSKFFVDIYGMGAAPLESISLNSNTEPSQYLEDWNNRYDPLIAIGTGIVIGIEWNNGFGLSAGLEYQRLESQYKTSQTITEISTIYDPMAYFYYNMDNEIVYVGDSVTSVTTYDRTISHANTTTLLNIPIQASYNLFQKGPLKIKGTLSGIFNLSLQYKGHFLQADNSLILIDDSNQETFVQSRLGIGIEGGLHFGYLLNPHWELYLSPRYRYNQSTYWDDNSPILLSRDYLGLRTGIKYLF